MNDLYELDLASYGNNKFLHLSDFNMYPVQIFPSKYNLKDPRKIQKKTILVLVRALKLAQLDSNRAYINALARFLPSSARLESELAQLNSNSTLQLDELDRAFRAIQLVNIGAITE